MYNVVLAISPLFACLILLTAWVLPQYSTNITDHQSIPDKDQIKIYVISLERTPARYDSMVKQWNNFGLKHKKFNAIDGYNLIFTRSSDGKTLTGRDIVNVATIKNFSHNQQVKFNCSTGGVTFTAADIELSAGELGVLCSHVSIWREIAEGDDDEVLVLEDDAKLSANFKERLTEITQATTATNFDFLYVNLWRVGHHYNPYYKSSSLPILRFRNAALAKIFAISHKPILRLNQRLILKRSVLVPWGFASYIITKTAAQRALQHFANKLMPIDNYTVKLMEKGILQAYVTIDPLVSPNEDIPSTIKAMGRDH